MKYMKAAVVEDGNLSIVDMEIPRLQENEVLIKVQLCGICSTDIMILNGKLSREFQPLVPGHEFIGYISETGSQVTKWHAGDYVTADINIGCGVCRFCLQNQPLACSDLKQIGIHTDGGFAEYVIAPADKVFKLSGNTASEEYALIEPVANVVRSIKRCGSLLGRSVLVVGGNFMSLLHLQLAKLSGAWPVYIATDNFSAIEFAESFGVDGVIENIDEAVRSNDRFDFVFETEGTADAAEKAIKFLSPGGCVLSFGLPEPGVSASWEPFDFILKEQRMVSSVAGSGTDVYDAIRLIESGRLDLGDFVKTVLPLDRIRKGFRLEHEVDSVFKVLIKVGE